MTTQATEDRTIRRALRILESRVKHLNDRLPIHSQIDARNYLILLLAQRKTEAFVVMFLDGRHQLVECRTMFEGTVDQASVYTREVVRAVIETNAVAIVLAHNHPAGNPEPSDADRSITLKLQRAMALIDVRVLDHFVIGSTRAVSFAERGWM